ncbi:biotin--[acetyl-CoA-carboxylase] ligase [Aquabacterium sp.]|uniref:biotin--[acetyl-CoA-carboxylase] ligase n=1 Tax=Aquabacterium sp. TaxID=1872578 RepID=UPI002B69C00F|nr:biotin--[acetyl-CoA-carboxylase] ligase [Aquabacterium sp.]HSW07861.1 biotin--[acetyl-CoA-carboxylase] ligase [Aquabacterium sp.]
MADQQLHHLHWGAEALWHQLQPLLPGLAVEVVARSPSTNTQLLDRARHAGTGHASSDEAQGRRTGDKQPCLLVAEQQTHGRGRQGKAWFASHGASLTFSLSLPLAPADWSGLSLAVGVALADALDPLQPEQAPRIGLKWPNDLLLLEAGGLGRKLGGILIETVSIGTQRMAVIGIGLNVLPQPMAELAWGYACLQELQADISAPQALALLAAPLVRTILAFEREGFAPLQAAYARRDALHGRAVSTTLAELPEGVADGLDDKGALWLRVGAERHRVSSGEVSIRVAAAGAGSTGVDGGTTGTAGEAPAC